jgi:hypothetical protein
MNFHFVGLLPGESSKFMFLDTNALDYARTGIFDLTDLGQSQNSSDYGMFAPSQSQPPSQSVPEPSIMLLFSSGLIGLAGLRRKFSK